MSDLMASEVKFTEDLASRHGDARSPDGLLCATADGIVYTLHLKPDAHHLILAGGACVPHWVREWWPSGLRGEWPNKLTSTIRYCHPHIAAGTEHAYSNDGIDTPLPVEPAEPAVVVGRERYRFDYKPGEWREPEQGKPAQVPTVPLHVVSYFEDRYGPVSSRATFYFRSKKAALAKVGPYKGSAFTYEGTQPCLVVDGYAFPIGEAARIEAGLVERAMVDPLHARARAAIDRLDLDGSRLELAVAVFGWGSDEANGSLLGLVRVAWDDDDAFVSPNGQFHRFMVWIESEDPEHENPEGPSIPEALVSALESMRAS